MYQVPIIHTVNAFFNVSKKWAFEIIKRIMHKLFDNAYFVLLTEMQSAVVAKHCTLFTSVV